jgi:hypothetical protein
MDAASGVDVIRSLRVKAGPVGVSGNQGTLCFHGIAAQALFHPVLVHIIFGRAGRVKDAKMLHGFPKVADEKTCQFPAGGVEKIGLVPVCQKQSKVLRGIFQNQALIKRKILKERPDALLLTTKAGIKEQIAKAGFFLFHIMIAVYHIESALSAVQGKEPEHVAVYFDDLAHFPVFPELIPVSQLNIGKSPLIVVRKGRKIKVLIFQKVVVGISPAPVTVADDGIAALP